MFMSKTSPIPNKRPITLSVNDELVKKAQLLGLNISLILDAALEREINPESRDNFIQAIQKKLTSIEGWFENNNSIKNKYYDDVDKSRGGEKNVRVVSEKEREQSTVREILRGFENNR